MGGSVISIYALISCLLLREDLGIVKLGKGLPKIWSGIFIRYVLLSDILADVLEINKDH